MKADNGDDPPQWDDEHKFSYTKEGFIKYLKKINEYYSHITDIDTTKLNNDKLNDIIFITGQGNGILIDGHKFLFAFDKTDDGLFINLSYRNNKENAKILDYISSQKEFIRIFGNKLPQNIQTKNDIITLCFSVNTNSTNLVYDEKSIENNLIKENTKTFAQKFIAVVQKNKFKQFIESQLPKTYTNCRDKWHNYEEIYQDLSKRTKEAVRE